MLKQRLLFGTLMTLTFVGLMVLDGSLDGSIRASAHNKKIQATILCLFIIGLTVVSQLEMARLIDRIGSKVFTPITIVSSILLATAWYWRQFHPDEIRFQLFYVLFVSACSLFAVLVYQARRFATNGVLVNCATNFFAIFYLGFLSSFILGIRIDFVFWPVFMFVFTVKSSYIGAYTIGKLLGKHKFSPKISPGKTIEGLIGAMVFASIVACLFSRFCGIMNWPIAIVFGAIFAFLGQLGDLAESMIKRDAQQKDSADSVPGFGGVLDIIDSPLATAPAAYLFFLLAVN